MGLGDVAERVIPKPVLVSAPQAGGTITVRYFTPRACHRSVAATGAVGLATACVLPGSLAQEFAGPPPHGPTTVIVLEHPAGRIPIELELAPQGAEVPVLRASLIRTARRLFAGSVFVPDPPTHLIREFRDAQQTHAARHGAGRRRCRAGAASAAAADTYPDRPIKLVVPYAAGGGTDAIARVIAQGMTEQLGQQLVVENNGTAGGNVATAQAAKADPDGYTLLMANQGPMTVNPHLFKNVKIDPLTAFDPVTLIAEAPLVVVVPEGSRFASFQALRRRGRRPIPAA